MKNFRDFDSDFNLLIELMVAMIDARASSPITPGMGWLNDIQTLSIKLFKQLCSTKSLSDGCVFKSAAGKSIEFIDQGSVSILARASVETFLTLHWIFGCPSERSQFRHALWQYAGLTDRVNLNSSTDEGRVKQADVRVQQAELLGFIEGSPLLNEYSVREIKELKKGNGLGAVRQCVRASISCISITSTVICAGTRTATTSVLCRSGRPKALPTSPSSPRQASKSASIFSRISFICTRPLSHQLPISWQLRQQRQ